MLLEIMTEKERIEKIMLDQDLNSSQFANEIGIKSPTLSHILNGRNNPSLDVLKRILERYPNIHSDWLILGVGPIYRGKTQVQPLNLFSEDKPTINKSEEYKPKQVENLTNDSQVKQIKTEEKRYIDNKTEKSIERPNNKTVNKIIVYYDDNTFEEFYSK